jgi:uncharacterized membrane protein
MSNTTDAKPNASQISLAALFLIAGVLHFLSPANYLRIMPPYLPYPLALVYISGAAEILGGVGVLHPRTRRSAGIGLIALLIAVFPANVQMLINANEATLPVKLLLWLRLPLQALLIFWVWRATQASKHHTK